MARAQPAAKTGPEPTANPAERKKICESCGKERPVDTIFACSYCNMNFCLQHLIPTAHHCGGAFGKPMASRWYSEGT